MVSRQPLKLSLDGGVDAWTIAPPTPGAGEVRTLSRILSTLDRDQYRVGSNGLARRRDQSSESALLLAIEFSPTAATNFPTDRVWGLWSSPASPDRLGLESQAWSLS